MKDYKLGIGQIRNNKNLELDMNNTDILWLMKMNDYSTDMIQLKLWTFRNECVKRMIYYLLQNAL